MDLSGTPGIFLSVKELRPVYLRLKQNEAALNAPERDILLKIERVLYEHLSIQELEIPGEGSGVFT
ncbi:MAG: hypothetical protein LBQ44_02230 [Treponema sp.]|jgi:hypothetical protein|nr:hypothetical protein [Treponema sp.]